MLLSLGQADGDAPPENGAGGGSPGNGEAGTPPADRSYPWPVIFPYPAEMRVVVVDRPGGWSEAQEEGYWIAGIPNWAVVISASTIVAALISRGGRGK